jgi:hypothetical protein
MNRYTIVPDSGGEPIRHSRIGATRYDAAMRYGHDWPDVGTITVRDDSGESRFRIEKHTEPAGNCAWVTITATEIPEEQETK